MISNKPNSKIEGLILDMDGVVWRGNQAIGDLSNIFSRISGLGLKSVFATNNATSNAEQYVQKFASFGLEVCADSIVTSSLAVTKLLLQKFPGGGPVYIVGEIGLSDTLKEFGFYHSQPHEEVLAVVAGLDRQLTYEKLRIATLLIRKGIPFYGTNPDATFPAPEGLVPGAGTVLAAIETASGVKPIIAGKPFPFIMQTSMDRLGLPPEKCLVVGDRLDTDILGGKNAGCKTALVLTGVSTLEEVKLSDVQPDIIARTLESLIEQLSTW